jgi:hypothetical protein
MDIIWVRYTTLNAHPPGKPGPTHESLHARCGGWRRHVRWSGARAVSTGKGSGRGSSACAAEKWTAAIVLVMGWTCAGFFLFWFFKKNQEMNLSETYFQFLSHLNHVSQSHAIYNYTTHFHVDIRCHVNLIGLTTLFGIQNESHYFKCRNLVVPPILVWRDSF